MSGPRSSWPAVIVGDVVERSRDSARGRVLEIVGGEAFLIEFASGHRYWERVEDLDVIARETPLQ